MRGTGLVVVAAFACVLAGCDEPAGPRSDPGVPVEVTVLAMDADGSAPGRYAAIGESPIHLGAFASWYGRGADGADFDEVAGQAPPGSAYVAFTGNTGCRVPEDIAVRRDGADLEIRFTGGTEREECVRHIDAGVYFAVPADAVAGVRTVNGDPLLDPDGPGEQVGFVPLGDSGIERAARAAEFGTEAFTTLRTALFTARPDRAEQLSDALDRPVPDGERMFAFLVSGCAIESAVLVLGPDITADGSRQRTPVACETESHYLATFAVDADAVPEGATVAD